MHGDRIDSFREDFRRYPGKEVQVAIHRKMVNLRSRRFCFQGVSDVGGGEFRDRHFGGHCSLANDTIDGYRKSHF